MTYQQKNTWASLATSSLIVVFFLVRFFTILNKFGLEASRIYNLWFWVIGLTIFMTVLVTVLMHVSSAVVQQVQNPAEEPEVDSTEDERDALIKHKGNGVAYTISMLGAFFSMLTMVLGANPLVMFTMLIATGLLGTIGSDIAKLVMYGKDL